MAGLAESIIYPRVSSTRLQGSRDEPKPATAPTISEKSAIRKNTETNIELRLPDSASKIQVKQKIVGLSQDRLSIELGNMHD
jgi:hypothetical protein